MLTGLFAWNGDNRHQGHPPCKIQDLSGHEPRSSRYEKGDDFTGLFGLTQATHGDDGGNLLSSFGVVDKTGTGIIGLAVQIIGGQNVDLNAELIMSIRKCVN